MMPRFVHSEFSFLIRASFLFQVPKDAFVRLKHFQTDTWVHSTSIIIDKTVNGKPNTRPSMLKVGTAKSRDDTEAFAIMPVPPADVRNLDFCADISHVLQRNIDGILDGSISINDRKLQVLVCFESSCTTCRLHAILIRSCSRISFSLFWAAHAPATRQRMH